MCPFCGVGCQLTYHVKDNKILFVDGTRRPVEPRAPVREGPLRLRLRAPPAAPHQAADPQARRAEDAPTSPSIPRNWSRSVPRGDAGKRRSISPPAGCKQDPRHSDRYALAGFGSAKGSNEEAYLFQKLVRTGFGTNNVDHCTRLCHASSVAALLEGIGSGAVSNQVNDVRERRGDLPHRRQPDLEPSGRGDLDEERGEARREADRTPTRAAPTSRATRRTSCSSSPTPTSRC